MNTRRTTFPSLPTTASRAQFSPIRGSVPARISLTSVESPTQGASVLPTRDGAAKGSRVRRPLPLSTASSFTAEPVKITVADFSASSLRLADSRTNSSEIGRLWTPGLLDRLQSQLTRYHE